MNAWPQPDLVGLYKGEDFLIGDSVDITYDDKHLPMLYQLSDIFAEEGEGRVGDDDIRLLEKLDTFWTSEVSISL